MGKRGRTEPQREALVLMKDDKGVMKYAEVKNVDEMGMFTIDQVYLFPVNSVVVPATDESQTVLRIEIKAGTHYKEGYQTIRDCLEHLGCDPSEVAACMDMPEILA